MVRKAPILTAALCLLFSCSTSGDRRYEDGQFSDASSSIQRHPLFRVTKSENANYVNYDLLLRGGDFADEPLDVYWIMETGDGEEEGLNSYEVGLYGITIGEVRPRALEFRINGVDKVFDITLASGTEDMKVTEDTVAYTTIDGQRAVLTGIHLVIRKTWNPFSPDVEVQLTGISTEDQQQVTESIRN